MDSRIEIILGDITTLRVDAIVNAANEMLLGGGGVDGAIHRAAGPELLEECRKIGGCPTGEVRLTKGYNLPAKFVIHTVGPVWRSGHVGESDLLGLCYHNCLELAESQPISTIAFPSISTGVYGFPVELACRIALTEANRFLQNNVTIQKIILVCYDERTYKAYQSAAKSLFANV
jgi:O-acetyl-ADP-ribose deacetylase